MSLSAPYHISRSSTLLCSFTPRRSLKSHYKPTALSRPEDYGDIFSDSFLTEDKKLSKKEEGKPRIPSIPRGLIQNIDDPPKELIINLERRGDGWGEEIIPYVTVEWRPIVRNRRFPYYKPKPPSWSEGSIERELERAGVPVEYVDKVVAAVSAWRVTPGGRPLIDRRRRSRAQRNGRGVIDHLNKVCGVPLGPHGVGEILMRAPQILLIKIPYYDTWNVRVIELAAFMHLNGHCNVPENWSVSPSLGRWVKKLRVALVNGSLTEEREQIVSALGFRFEEGPALVDKEWEKMFDAYVDWAARMSGLDSQLDSTGLDWIKYGGWNAASLAVWAIQQRYMRERNELSAELIRRLDYFNFDWNPKIRDPKLRDWISKFGRVTYAIVKHRHLKRCKPFSLDDILMPHDRIKQSSFDWFTKPMTEINLKEGIPRLERVARLDPVLQIWFEEQRFEWRRGLLSFEKTALIYALRVDLDSYSQSEWIQMAHLATKMINGFEIPLQETALEDTEVEPAQTSRKLFVRPLDIVSVSRMGDIVERLDLASFKHVRDQVNVISVDPEANSASTMTLYNGAYSKDDGSRERLRVMEWILTQRRLHKENRLLDHRLEYLSILGLSWLLKDDIFDMPDEIWKVYFNRVKKDPNNLTPKLKEFIWYQRALHQIRHISSDRREAIESVGISIGLSDRSLEDRRWDQNISEILKLNELDEYSPLGKWLKEQTELPLSGIRAVQIKSLIDKFW